MGFLAPLYLFAAAAVAVPLLIHLLRRRIGLRLEFPAVRYLARAEREHSRKLRLRNLLLMLLRIAAIVFIALAAARPVLRLGSGGHAPTALALVLDNSLSTSAVVHGRPVLDGLRARARAIVRRAAPEDRLWLVTADGAVRGGSRDAVLAAIGDVEPLAGAGDVRRATERAAALVREGLYPERELAVITDGQATAWRAPISLGKLRARVYIPGTPAPPNRAVVDAVASPPRWTPRGAVRARVRGADSVTYRITLDGRTLARGTAARDEEIVVRAAPPERGWASGTVEIEPDELRGDDVRHFAVWIGPAPGVAVHPAAGPFARSAVEALIQAERVAAGSDVAVVPADEATKLPALLLAPADPVRVGAANRVLERMGVPWRFGALRRGEAVVRADSSGAASLAGVTATTRYALQRRTGDATDTVATAGGEPWVVRGAGYTLIASPLVPEATTLPVRAGFVPWLGDVLTQRFGEDAGQIVAATPNATVARPRAAEALESPGGGTRPLSGETFAAPERPGAYFFTRGGRRVGALVVNAEPGESALERLDAAGMAGVVRSSDVRITADSLALPTTLLASRSRRSVMLPLLLVALAVVLGESLVVTGGRRRARAAGVAAVAAAEGDD